MNKGSGMDSAPKWLVAYGSGGCWSGYESAIVISCADKDKAKSIAFELVCKEFPYGGCSYDVEQITGSIESNGLYCSRLKPSAKAMIASEIGPVVEQCADMQMDLFQRGQNG